MYTLQLSFLCRGFYTKENCVCLQWGAPTLFFRWTCWNRKNFLLKGLLAFYHRQMKKVMVIASSGIAAIMYPTGQTAHKALNIPIYFDDGTILKIPQKSKLFKDLEELSLLVFDEISMISKQILDLIDRSFRILFQCPEPFGGKRIVFAGDFRQILPVIRNGSKAQVVA